MSLRLVCAVGHRLFGGPERDLEARAKAQSAENMLDMRSDRPMRDDKLIRNLFVGQTAANQSRDLPLARRQSDTSARCILCLGGGANRRCEPERRVK